MKYIYGNKLLEFTTEVVDILKSYRQVEPEQHESGGILLGKVFNDKIVVEQITIPSSDDKSGRYFFERNVKRAQWYVDMAWKQTDGEVIYLGEWHTHPENVPSPSTVDRRLISNMLKDTKMSTNFLFLVIIGLVSDYVAVQSREKKWQLLQLKRQ